MPYTELSAATKIQSVWRGYKTRQSFAPPHTCLVTSFRTLINGNEPDPVFPHDKKLSGHFVFVGTGGLRNLSWINALTDARLHSKDGYAGIPKLFIVDNSKHVESFWRLLKKAAAKATTLKDFEIQVLLEQHAWQAIVHKIYAHASRDLLSATRALIHDSEERYQYFRNIIGKLTFVCDDWANAEVFTYIRSVTAQEVPIVVYASNIVEYVAMYSVEMRIKPIFPRILSHIESLNPVYTIHTRTSMKWILDTAVYRPNGVAWSIRPDTQLLLNNEQVKTQHLAVLESDSLWSLTEGPELERPNDNKSCCTIL